MTDAIEAPVTLRLKYEPCYLCGGSGMESVYRPMFKGRPYPNTYVGTVDCERCKGSGWLPTGACPFAERERK